jgi:L-alanine-DL-glutamate epimerase-like enolase superfamily enzyme
MKITRIISHVLQYGMPKVLGYAQQYNAKRSAHLVEVQTDEGATCWGECFGSRNIAIANNGIVEKVIQPLVLGMDPMDRDVIWHKLIGRARRKDVPRFRDPLLAEPLSIQDHGKNSGCRAKITTGPKIGVEPDMDFTKHYSIDA